MPVARPSKPHPRLSWWGWGDPAQVPELPEAALALLRDGLGVRDGLGHPDSLAQLALSPPRLDPASFSGILGSEHVLADEEARIRHTRGKSTPDLLRLRAADLTDAPDLVLQPSTHEEIMEVLRTCSERRVAVVPFGGGTSVVGGLTPEAAGFSGVIALDLARMDALVELDKESRVAVLEPGLRGPEAETLLRARGYTIGHFPQSFEYATLGGFAATRSSGQASAGYGRFDDLVVALRLAAPAGTLVAGRAPKSAAGPDLRQLVLGSEGILGVITSLSVSVRPVPEKRVFQGWRLASFAAGLPVVRKLAQDEPLPSVVRLSDETETALNLARPGELGSGGAGCLAIVGFEGTADHVRSLSERAGGVLAAAGGELEPGAGEAWEHDRFRAPYLRDALLDAGALVETLETVAFWSALPGVYEAVRQALRDSLAAQGTPPVVLCHVSHVYAAGASLYFTVGAAQTEDPVTQWHTAKAAASEAILTAGGSITHHHGVGVDHRPWYEREVGALGVETLRAVKRRLDPAGIMNPGVVIPAAPAGE